MKSDEFSTRKSVCIIELSAPEIRCAIFTDGQFENVDLKLQWDVGFQQKGNGTLTACFDDTLAQLDSNSPREVRFTELDLFLKEITDIEVLTCLFQAFFEEIFHRRLPEHGYPVEAMSVYFITPYQWSFVHRQQLRQAFKRIENNSRGTRLTPSNMTLRSLFSQALCLVVHYQEAWENRLTDTSKLHLFLIDFTRYDLILYQLTCDQLVDYVMVELCDILRIPDFFMDVEKKVLEVSRVLKTVEEILPVTVGFSGNINPQARAIIELLQARCSVTFLEPQETATLSGGAQLVQQFEEKNLVKPFHFVYHFCFGVRLPDGNWIELVPKMWTPPYHRKKAFRVTGALEKIHISLFCGLSLADKSDVHRLATLEIDYPMNNNSSSRNSPEFILSVTLDDFTHGTFAVHFPNSHEPSSVEFTVPVLMD